MLTPPVVVRCARLQHGGKRAAAWAHANLVNNLLSELSRALPLGKEDTLSGVLDGAAVDAFHRTDANFLRHASTRGIPDGSTAVTCMIQAIASGASGGGGSGKSDRRLLVANLGDSRCVMVRDRPRGQHARVATRSCLRVDATRSHQRVC